MPRSSSFSDAFNGSLRGLGDIGTAINDKRRTDASVAASNASAANSIAETEGRKSAFARLTKEDALKASLASATSERLSLPDSVSNPMPSKQELLMYSQLTGKSPEEVMANISKTKGEATGTDLENQGKKQTIDFNTNLMPKKLIGVDLDNQKTGQEIGQSRQLFKPKLADANLQPTKTQAEIDLLGANSDKATKDAKTAKLPNKEQFDAAGYGRRVESAIGVLDGLENGGYNRASIGSAIGSILPNIIPGKSDQSQQQDQAERNFINANLRRESGAAISTGEFKNAEIQYFPRAGDSEKVLEQKAQNRAQVKENLRASSGAAWDQVQSATAGRKTDASAPTAGEHSQDSEAVMWAKSNPTDPRAMKILKANGL